MVDILELRNRSLTCGIAPELGAAVVRLDLARRGSVLPLLTPTPTEALVRGADPRLFSLAHIAPYGGAIRHNRFRWEGKYREVQPNLPDCPLFTHGVASQRPWVGKKDGASSATFSCLYKKQPEWPFDFSLTAVFDLDQDNLAITYELANEGRQGLMPYGFGATLRIPRGRQTSFFAGVSSLWHQDDAHVPTRMGEVPFALDPKEGIHLDKVDTSERWFSGWVGKASVDHADQRVSLTVKAESPLTHIGFGARAGEPDFRLSLLNHVPGALDIMGHDDDETGFAVLGPGESVSAKIRIDVDTGFF